MAAISAIKCDTEKIRENDDAMMISIDDFSDSLMGYVDGWTKKKARNKEELKATSI